MQDNKSWGIDQIKIIKNFLSKEEIKYYISWIDTNDHLMKRSAVHGEKSKNLPFSKKTYSYRPTLRLSELPKIETKLRNEIFPRFEKTVKEIYKNEKDLAVSDMFFAKQGSGANVPEHSDVEDGSGAHVKYSGIIYLNTMKMDGLLTFPKLNYEYKPEAGDLVTFPSVPKEYAHYVKEISEDRYTIPIWATEDFNWKL